MKKNFRRFKRKLNKQGFTLIELLLSLAIIAILTGASLSIARFADTQKNLTLSANQLRALIRSAQTYALAMPLPSNKHICGFGVYFSDEKTANLFYTTAPSFENPKIACDGYLKASVAATQRTNLESIIFPVNLSSGFGLTNDVFFRVPYGQVYNNGIFLSVNNSKRFTFVANSVTKNVTVYGTGRLE